MCSSGCQLQTRRNYKHYLAQNQETNFEYWKILGLSVAIPALINIDKSGKNHLKLLFFLKEPYRLITGPSVRPGLVFICLPMRHSREANRPQPSCDCVPE